jgi:hypothetical protein
MDYSIGKELFDFDMTKGRQLQIAAENNVKPTFVDRQPGLLFNLLCM